MTNKLMNLDHLGIATIIPVMRQLQSPRLSRVMCTLW